MPLAPFHLGPGLLIGLLLLSYIDFATFLVASIIIDVEPIVVIIFDLDYPLHGFFHSFLGGTIVAFLLAAVMSKVRESLSPLLSFFKLEQKSTFKKILLASLTGIYIHILLDSRMHKDIQPFYPLDFNPFLSSSALHRIVGVHIMCLVLYWSSSHLRNQAVSNLEKSYEVKLEQEQEWAL